MRAVEVETGQSSIRVTAGWLETQWHPRTSPACRWGEAERCYVAAGQVPLAVAMYRKAGHWEALLRLVAAHQREALQQVGGSGCRGGGGYASGLGICQGQSSGWRRTLLETAEGKTRGSM